MAKKVEVRSTGKIPSGSPLASAGRHFYQQLDSFRLDTLRNMAAFLLGEKLKSTVSKDQVRLLIANFLCFKGQTEFDEFFKGLAPWLKDALTKGAFWEYVDIPTLERKYKLKLVIKDKNSYYGDRFVLNPAEDTALFLLFNSFTLLLAEPFCSAFSTFLPKPELYGYQSSAELPVPPSEVWSNEPYIIETFPLMLEALQGHFSKNEARYRIINRTDKIKKGLLKTDIKTLRPLCGQREFPSSKNGGPEPIDLFFRYIVAMDGRDLVKGDDKAEDIKALVTHFFTPQRPDLIRSPLMGAFFEFAVLNEHLGLKNANDVDIPQSVPPSRLIFHQALLDAATHRQWVEVEALYWSLFLHRKSLRYSSAYTEQYGLRYRADTMNLDGEQYQSDLYSRVFPPIGPLRHRLLALPLFKGYWYLMATLGIVEIVDSPPPLLATRNGKPYAISAYDGLRYARVTDFGAWCLGLSTEKKLHAPQQYEAIADKDLLLVTFRGHSLERKLFLELIGTPLGEDRFRINEATFARSCADLRDLKARIQKFKTLIEPNPSKRWQTFFQTLLARSTLFAQREGAFLFKLNYDSNVVMELLRNPKIRALCFRTEGNRLAVRSQDYKKFTKALQEQGFFFPEEEI